MSTDRVGIIGIGQSRFTARRDDASYPDLVREAVVLAMNDAGLQFDDIEAVVYSLSPDPWWASAMPSVSASRPSARETNDSCASTRGAPPVSQASRPPIITSPRASATSC